LPFPASNMSFDLPPFSPGLPTPSEVWPLPEGNDNPPAEIWEGTSLRAVGHPALGYYPATGNRNDKPAVIICPGGGYTSLAMEHEGTSVAAWLNSMGISAFILKSRLREHGHPAPLRDACSAVRRVRAAAAKLAIRADRIGIIGFSAGGHLAAHTCTTYADPVADDADLNFRHVSARPDFAILLYPVIVMEFPHVHLGSRTALLGSHVDPMIFCRFSLHQRITANTPPTCLIHAQDDGGVPVENSILYFNALRSAGVPAAMHIYPHGGHGFGLGRAKGPIANWPQRCAEWLQAEGWLT